MATKVVSQTCPERERLVAELRNIETRLSQLHDQQIEVLKRGDVENDRTISQQIRQAYQHWDQAIQNLNNHTLEHGC